MDYLLAAHQTQRISAWPKERHFVLGLLGYLPAFALEFLGPPLVGWGGSTGMPRQLRSP